MENKARNKMIVLTLIGTSGLFAPGIAINYGGRFGWLIIAAAGLISAVYTGIILWINKWNEGDLWGKLRSKKDGDTVNVAGNLLCAGFIFKYIFLSGLLILALCRVVKMHLLGEANYLIILISLLVLGIYGGSKGKKGIFRLSEFVFYVVVFPVIFLLILSIRGIDTGEIVDLLAVKNFKTDFEWGSFISGVLILTFLFSPSEMLILEPKAVSKTDEANISFNKNIGKWGIYLITLLITVFNLVLYFLCAGKIGIPVAKAEGDATIKLMENIRIGSRILNKHVGVYLSFFIVMIMIAVCLLFAHSFNLVKRMNIKINWRCQNIALGVLVFIVSIFILNNSNYYSDITKFNERRTDINERKYVDAIFMEYADSKYNILMTFAGENNEAVNLSLYDIFEVREEYEKSLTGQADFSDLQAIIINTALIHDDKVFENVIELLMEEKTLPDNAFVFATGTELKEYSDEYLKDGAKLPGKEMSEIVNNSDKFEKTTFGDIKKLIYKMTNKSDISIFNFKDGRLKFSGTESVGISVKR